MPWQCRWSHWCNSLVLCCLILLLWPAPTATSKVHVVLAALASLCTHGRERNVVVVNCYVGGTPSIDILKIKTTCCMTSVRVSADVTDNAQRKHEDATAGA